MSLFITLEGGEGSGKSTQSIALAKALRLRGHDVLTTREPGGTPEGECVRALLVERDKGEWTPMAETLLLFASRVMHVERVIAPALQEGKIVICDRFTDSTRVYQGYAGGQPLNEIEILNTLVLDTFGPDITFILDIPPSEGLNRTHIRMHVDMYRTTEDKFEHKDILFHEALREGYRKIAYAHPSRCHMIDALQPIETITQALLTLTLAKLEK